VSLQTLKHKNLKINLRNIYNIKNFYHLKIRKKLSEKLYKIFQPWLETGIHPFCSSHKHYSMLMAVAQVPRNKYRQTIPVSKLMLKIDDR